MKTDKKTPDTSQTRYRRIFECSPDGLLILDAATGTIADANPFMIGLCGHSHEYLPGKKLCDIGFFESESEFEGYLRELENTSVLHLDDVIFHSKSGQKFDLEFTSNTYIENERQVVLCVIRDVTERRFARQRLDQKTALLAQIAGKAAKLGGWSIRLPERTLQWSNENCDIHEVPHGYEPTLEEGISYYPEEFREEVIRHVETCAAEGIPYDFELPKYTAKGRLIWVRSIGEAIRDTEGNIIGLQGAFQDITARKIVEAEKENLIKELQDALAEVKTLQEFLPLCSYCKKVRDDQNYWTQIESYISNHTDTQFSHGICPECYKTNVEPQLRKFVRQNPKNQKAR